MPRTRSRGSLGERSTSAAGALGADIRGGRAGLHQPPGRGVRLVPLAEGLTPVGLPQGWDVFRLGMHGEGRDWIAFRPTDRAYVCRITRERTEYRQVPPASRSKPDAEMQRAMDPMTTLRMSSGIGHPSSLTLELLDGLWLRLHGRVSRPERKEVAGACAR